MAKKQKIDNDLLLEAVVKYANICKGKIKIQGAGRMVNGKYPGLEEVKDYMFSRPMIRNGSCLLVKRKVRIVLALFV